MNPCGLCGNCKEDGVTEMSVPHQMFEVDEERMGLIKLRKVRNRTQLCCYRLIVEVPGHQSQQQPHDFACVVT